MEKSSTIIYNHQQFRKWQIAPKEMSFFYPPFPAASSKVILTYKIHDGILCLPLPEAVVVHGLLERAARVHLSGDRLETGLTLCLQVGQLLEHMLTFIFFSFLNNLECKAT